MPQPVAYVALILPPSDALRAKIMERHNVTFDEVLEAAILTSVERSRWHFDPEKGWRLLITGTTAAQRRLNIVLYPVDQRDGIWRLGTAIPG